MTRTLVAVLLLSTAPVTAGEELDWLCSERHMPPAEYLWQLPDEPVVFYQMSPELVIRSCLEGAAVREFLAKPQRYGACTNYEEGFGWVINYRDDLTPDQRACLLRHELAHTVPNADGVYWTHEYEPMRP